MQYGMYNISLYMFLFIIIYRGYIVNIVIMCKYFFLQIYNHTIKMTIYSIEFKLKYLKGSPNIDLLSNSINRFITNEICTCGIHVSYLFHIYLCHEKT